MLTYIYASELASNPALAESMFRDRAGQFHTRLGWDVTVDDRGWERDDYDDLNPLYVIWTRPDGLHGGSMRFLPTTGRTMVNDHFSHLTGGTQIRSPFIWECTRFCLSAQADSRVAAALMLGGGEIMRGFHVDHFVGVFDHRMTRIYRLIGSSPEVMGSSGEGRDAISVGLWSFDPESREKVLSRAGVTSEQSENWFQSSFGRPVDLLLSA